MVDVQQYMYIIDMNNKPSVIEECQYEMRSLNSKPTHPTNTQYCIASRFTMLRLVLILFTYERRLTAFFILYKQFE